MTLTPDSRNELAKLLVAAISEREAQLGRVSRLLHDEVGQVLSAVGLQLDVLRLDLTGQSPEIVPRTLEIQKLLERAMVLVRDLSTELHPSMVDRVGLQYALERLVGRFREGFPGTVRLLSDPGMRVPPQQARLLYNIAERALDNAMRHAQATQVELLLRPKQKLLVLEIRDNGCGFDLEKVRRDIPGSGLLMMDFYASRGGMALAIEAAPGKGTIVKATLPEPAAGVE